MEKREEILFFLCYDVIVVSWPQRKTLHERAGSFYTQPRSSVRTVGYFYARRRQKEVRIIDDSLEARLRLGADRALDLMLETLQDPEAPLKQRVEVAQLMLDRVCGKGPRPAETGPVRVVLEGSAARCGM